MTNRNTGQRSVEIFQIGRTAPRADARAKVTGREKYAADLYSKDQLWAGVKRAGIAHAKLLHIDTGKARQLPGIVTVLTHKDIKGSNRQGVARKDQPVLVDDRIRHTGDAVALVVAENLPDLKKAIDLITFTTDPLPGIFTLEAALDKNAPLIHPDQPDGNILLQGELETGDGAGALEDCDFVVESSFTVARQEHAYLETECGFAVYREGVLEITASTQTPFRDRSETADALGLALDKVRIIAPYLGGAFGGKDGITVQTLLGLAALDCPDRPIKMWWNREESLTSSAKRHRAELNYRLGADRDGTFKALQVEVDFDTGPYDHLGGVVLALGLEHAGGPYRIPHTRIRGRSIYTNNPVGGAFRGFGVPQVAAAMEQVVDMMAVKTGLSPLAIRRKNGVRRGDKNPLGVTLQTSTGLLDCLREIEQHPFSQKAETWKKNTPPGKLRGVGIAAVMHGMGYGPMIPDTANAKLELSREGKFKIYCGVVDMGQGNATTYQQIAGDILNQDQSGLELIQPDTSRTLNSGSSSASRTTYTFGNALIGAARNFRKRLCQKAADRMMITDWREFALLPGVIRHLPSGREITLQQMALLMSPDERIITQRFRAPVNREQPTKQLNLKLHGIPHLIFSYGVHLAAVEIDQLTGAVAVLKYITFTDCGTLINPQLFEQQMQGGIAQGIGYALYEDLKVEKGVVLTPDFATYIIPGSQDLPRMSCKAIHQPEASGPYGLKGVGEIAIDAPRPTVANAVADACGSRCRDFPLTAERLLKALEKE